LTSKKLLVGVVGLGPGAAKILPSMQAMPNIELVAGADVNAAARAAFEQRYQAKAYDSIEKLCDAPDIDAVFVATSNVYHCAHTIAAVQRGKHVMVE